MKKRIQINGLIIFLCVVLILTFPAQFLRLQQGRFDLGLQMLGMFLIFSGILLRVSGRGFKSEHSDSGRILVTAGPYALVRNPMYAGLFCIALGLILFMFQWWVLIILAVFFSLRYITLIFKEEKILARNFGWQYIDYQKRVRRALPHPAMLFTRRVADYFPLKPSWIKKETNSILPLLIVVYAFALWQGLFRFLILLGLSLIFVVSSAFLTRHDEKISD